MTELAYVTSRFDERFRAFRGASILVHGSREYAREILRQWGGVYRFCGIASFEPVEPGDFPGVPIVPAEKIWDSGADLILLTERVRYAEAAYQSLHGECRRRGVALYDMYGLDELALHDKAAEYPLYTHIDMAAWRETLSTFDLVVFETVETAARETGGGLELRPLFPPLIAWLEEQGVRTAFSLRRSVPESVQIEALQSFRPEDGFRVFPETPAALDGKEPFLIRREGEDLSLRRLRELRPSWRILYVGCGLVYEYILPQYYGIEAWRFMDQYDCLAPLLAAPPREEAVDRDRFAAECRHIIDASGGVSFDVFDTLLVRRVLRPEDVFTLTERRLRAVGLPAEGFARRRVGAQRDLVCGSLEQIYDALQPRMGWSDGQRQTAVRTELAVEGEVLCPRQDGAALLAYALARGKPTALVSDMYLPAETIRELLARCGIQAPADILVSCEQGKTKKDGLFRVLRSRFGTAGKLVHFGDQSESDGACRREDIRFVRLPPILQRAAAQGWSGSLQAAATVDDSCLLGSALAALYAEGAEEDRLRSLAVGILGPILVGYVSWLIERLREKPYDAVLFFARDGWMLFRLYEKLRIRMMPALPRPLYFYTSRHAALWLRAADPSVMEEMIRQGKGAGLSAPELLERVYGLPREEILPMAGGETWSGYLTRHRGSLLEKERMARQGHESYLRTLELGGARLCAVSDFFASGSTQRYLQSVTPFRMEGFYAGTSKALPEEDGGIAYYLPGESETLYRNFIELEGFFTSPEPSVDHLRENGEIVFAEEIRDAGTLETVRLVQEQALDFAESFFARFGYPENGIRGALIERAYEARDGQPIISAAYNDLIKQEIHGRTWIRGRKEP